MPQLRILFPPPGWFLADSRMEVHLDGIAVYDGSFKAGMDVTREVTPGEHRIQAFIHVGPIARVRQYAVHIPDRTSMELKLAYSRVWGNFKSEPTIHRTD